MITVDRVAVEGDGPLVGPEAGAWLLEASEWLAGNPEAMALAVRLLALAAGADRSPVEAREDLLEELEWQGFVRAEGVGRVVLVPHPVRDEY